MTVGIKLGSITDEIGTSDLFHAFFSTIALNLEAGRWGARFPVLMGKLYQGELRQIDAGRALAELDQVAAELATYSPSRVVWDADDRTKRPPWGDRISPDITDLSSYFVTSTGRDLLATLREVIVELRDRGGVASVVSY